MNFNRIRASALTALATIALVGMAAGGASAAEPVIHNSGSTASASVIHVSGTITASQTIHETTARGGALVGPASSLPVVALANTDGLTVHKSTATGGALVALRLGN